MDVMGKAVQRAFQAALDAAVPAGGLGQAVLDAAALADGLGQAASDAAALAGDLGQAASDAAALADGLGQAALDAAALADGLGQAALDAAALAGGPHLIGYFPSKRNPDASPFVPPSDHCLYNLLILGIHIQLDQEAYGEYENPPAFPPTREQIGSMYLPDSVLLFLLYPPLYSTFFLLSLLLPRTKPYHKLIRKSY